MNPIQTMFTVEWVEYQDYSGIVPRSFTGTLQQCLEVLHNLEELFLAVDPVFVQGDFSIFIPVKPYPESNIA